MDDRQLKKVLTASALRQIQLIDEALPPEAELAQITPSQEFQQKMQSILTEGSNKIRMKQQYRKRLGKMVAVFVFLFTVTFGTILSADASRASFINFFERCFSITHVQKQSWDKDFNAQVSKNLKNAYLPAWIPENYLATSSSQSNSGNCIINYNEISNKNHFIRLSEKITTVRTLNDRDLEGLTKLTADQQTFYFGEKERSGVKERNLVWVSGDRYFLITSSLEKDDLLKIAQSLVFKE